MEASMGESTRESVLVTGAGGGLGLETALTLAGRGFRVFAGVRDASQWEGVGQAASERGVRVDVVPLDVEDETSIAAALDGIVATTGGLFGVVNNAARTLRGYFEDLEEEEVRQVFEVNLFGTMRVIRHALPLLRGSGRGRIVVMSSIAGRVGSPGVSAYVATKFALEGFAESLALETAPLGIRVAIIEPGIVATSIWAKNRRVAALARNPTRPYHAWFRRAESEADKLVRTSTVTPADVANGVLRALTDPRPRLRYTIGRRASLVITLRRYLPGELFERLYFGEVLRRITGRRRFAAPGRTVS
jgi:NAD(P)-dependent dehydrogenase (short-subunit alcohol dehydrogenase family)